MAGWALVKFLGDKYLSQSLEAQETYTIDRSTTKTKCNWDTETKAPLYDRARRN